MGTTYPLKFYTSAPRACSKVWYVGPKFGRDIYCCNFARRNDLNYHILSITLGQIVFCTIINLLVIFTSAQSEMESEVGSDVEVNEQLDDEEADTIMTAEVQRQDAQVQIRPLEPKIRDGAKRQIYLITYSQANVDKYDRESFAKFVVDAFNDVQRYPVAQPATVEQWVCSKEDHKLSGVHFHLALKLSKVKRWEYVKAHIESNSEIRLHFSDTHSMYYSAWTYVTKYDDYYVESEGHTDMVRGPPRTARAVPARRAAAAQAREDVGGKKKKKEQEPRMTNLEFQDLVIRQKLETLLHVRTYSKRQQRDGKMALREFLANRTEGRVCDLIREAWAIETAEDDLYRSQKTRKELLIECIKEACTCKINSQWQELALQTLQRNRINVDEYTRAMRRALKEGRGKGRNIIHVGESNCAKSFLIQPLKLIYRAFENPSHGTFNWIGIDTKEIIILNDFRWSKKVIEWEQFLLLLEGDAVNFPAPKNVYSCDIKFNKDTPIIATSGDPITYSQQGQVVWKETKMMKNRWKIFPFTYELKQEQIIEIPPCKSCYARFIYTKYAI